MPNETLTFETDRLPTLVGATDLFANILNVKPILGLWKEPLPYELDWSTKTPGKRLDISNIPSWSRMSMKLDALGEPNIKLFTRQTKILGIVQAEICWNFLPLTSKLKSLTLLVELRIVILGLRLEEETRLLKGLELEHSPTFVADHYKLGPDEQVGLPRGSLIPIQCLVLQQKVFDRFKLGAFNFLILEKVDRNSETGRPAYQRPGYGHARSNRKADMVNAGVEAVELV